MQIGARRWAKHDKVRQRLASCVEEMEREERIKKMRDQWRAQGQALHHHQKTAAAAVAAQHGVITNE